MAAVTIRNLSDETHQALRRRARQHGRSTEAEIRDILDATARPKDAVGIGTAMVNLFREAGGVDLEITRDQSLPREIDFG